jgi:hypothetical protein
MCPACMTTAAMMTLGATSAGGLIAFVVSKWRALLKKNAQCTIPLRPHQETPT